MTVHQERISLTIHRPPNTGLGISIAGGIGSTPYKDNDYVRHHAFISHPFIVIISF
jgi:hypothetical protein